MHFHDGESVRQEVPPPLAPLQWKDLPIAAPRPAERVELARAIFTRCVVVIFVEALATPERHRRLADSLSLVAAWSCRMRNRYHVYQSLGDARPDPTIRCKKDDPAVLNHHISEHNGDDSFLPNFAVVARRIEHKCTRVMRGLTSGWHRAKDPIGHKPHRAVLSRRANSLI
jgi:hypothetical protein